MSIDSTNSQYVTQLPHSNYNYTQQLLNVHQKQTSNDTFSSRPSPQTTEMTDSSLFSSQAPSPFNAYYSPPPSNQTVNLVNQSMNQGQYSDQLIQVSLPSQHSINSIPEHCVVKHEISNHNNTNMLQKQYFNFVDRSDSSTTSIFLDNIEGNVNVKEMK
jgi:hypothetical protein